MKIKEELQEKRSKNNTELIFSLKKNYDDLRGLRFQAKMRELKNVASVAKTKKKIAQILTILREKLTEEEKSEKEIERKNR